MTKAFNEITKTVFTTVLSSKTETKTKKLKQTKTIEICNL